MSETFRVFSMGRRGRQILQTLGRSLSHQSTRQFYHHQVTGFCATWFESARLLNPFAGVNTEVSLVKGREAPGV